MDLFRSEYGLQGAVGFIGCQDPSSNFFHFMKSIIKIFFTSKGANKQVTELN